MVLVKTNVGSIVKLYVGYGSHLLYDCSGTFRSEVKHCREVMIDNGVFTLLRDNVNMHPIQLVEHSVKMLYKRVREVERLNKDAKLIIVVPDYPFNHEVNNMIYHAARSLLYKYGLHNYEKIYVAHGYDSAILDGVDADIIGVPVNKISIVPTRPEISFKKMFKVDRDLCRELIDSTIRRIREHGFTKIHLLGATSYTIRLIFNKCEEASRITSLDTYSYHFLKNPIDGKRMIFKRGSTLEKMFLDAWIRELGVFTVIEY